ncbi:hypothetical protein PENTCL1PPCAC_2733, partial [Pristionchus entomophagus]
MFLEITNFQPNCNINIPMFNLPRRGKGACFLKTPETATTTCWGDFCYWGRFHEVDDTRGCVDIAAADANFKLQLGESALDDYYFTICQGNYCNSDVKYENGTIVGPSAIRRFSTSLSI